MANIYLTTDLGATGDGSDPLHLNSINSAVSAAGRYSNVSVIDGSASVSAADLNALDRKTAGVVEFFLTPTLSGSATDILKAFGSSGIKGIAAANVDLSDTTLNASVLARSC